MGTLCLLAAFVRSASPEKLSGPRWGWKFAFKDFVLAAWSPPNAAEAEYALYKDAGFNLVMTPRYAFPRESLDLAHKHGLKVMVDTYTPNDKPWGGQADRYTPHPSHHPATLAELKWLHERIGTHPALAGYLLGDDIGVLPQELIDTTNFLRENAPHLYPWICQCNFSPESLARVGNPLADPQIYPTLYHRNMPAALQRDEFCRDLNRLRQSCRKYHLVSWPMFNICGSGTFGEYAVVSDSLLRFQPYSALAYGAQGLWYFTFRCLYDNAEGTPKSTPGLAVVKEVNHRVAAWGPRLLGCDAVAVFHTGFSDRDALPPGPKQLIRKMSDDLLVGLLVAKDNTVHAIVVDKRVEVKPDELAPREVKVEFSPDVKAVALMPAPGTQARTAQRHGVALTLPAGGGELLKLQGTGLAAKARQAEAEASAASRKDRKIGPDGLLVHLTFDEGQGNVAHDSSGAKNDALLSGARWVSGKLAGGLDLRSTADSAVISNAFLPAREAMTLSCWVNPAYPKEGYGPAVIVGSGGVDRLEFGFGPDDIYPVLSNQETHSGGALYVSGMKQLIPEGTWGHIAIAAGPHGATVYVNGVSRRQTDYVGFFDFQSRTVLLGCRYTENYTGLLDEVRIYNRCLSPEEVKRLSEGGK